MITLDSASGLIDIPKVLNYDDLMNRIKEVLQINDQLFKYLYFSYIDEEEQERTRLIPQIYDDFVNQENPKLSIGFLDNLKPEILDQLIDVIDINKKRFKEENLKQLNEDDNKIIDSGGEEEAEEKGKLIIIEKNNFSPSIQNNEKQENSISINENKNDNIIINNLEEKKEIKINNENDNIIINNLEEKKEININNENDNIISIKNDNNEIKVNDYDNIDLNIKKKESGFNLFSSEIKNDNIDNNKENYTNLNMNGNLDDSEFNLKCFEKEFNQNFDNLQKSMKNSNIEEYNKHKALEEKEEKEEKEFENNIKKIVESNINNMKNEIINSLIEASKIENKPKQKNSKNETIHNGIKCDNCGMFPIKGIRYKCMECNNFNYCEKCEKIGTHPHLFYKIKKNSLSKN